MDCIALKVWTVHTGYRQSSAKLDSQKYLQQGGILPILTEFDCDEMYWYWNGDDDQSSEWNWAWRV